MKQLKITVLIVIFFTLLCGLIYPLTVTGIGYMFFKEKAAGSLIVKNSSVIGSELLGQLFLKPEFFHGRPSTIHYDASLSGGSNFGQTNREFVSDIINRTDIIRREFRVNSNEIIPSDFLFSSASGLDPHISVEAALLQCERIASARNINKELLSSLVEKLSERQLSFYGIKFVNVLKLNIELDGLKVKK